MTKKDYELIATALVMTHSSAFTSETTFPGVDGYTLTCQYMADELERANPKFDRTRFLKACGVETK